jgi:hypothetical protein
MPDPAKKTSPATVLLAFAVVAIPLAWGLYRSVKNSMPLFTAAKATASVPAQPAPPATSH